MALDKVPTSFHPLSFLTETTASEVVDGFCITVNWVISVFSETLYTRLPVFGAFTCGLNAVPNLPSINLVGSNLASAAGLISNVTSLFEY